MKKMEIYLIIFLLGYVCSDALRYRYFNNRDSCLDMPFNICGNKGSLILTPLNKAKNLIGWWSFDDMLAIDHSGNGLDADEVPEVGPSYCN
jgi:hypothetical protein